MHMLAVKATNFVLDTYLKKNNTAKFLNDEGTIINGLLGQFKDIRNGEFSEDNKTAMIAKLGANLTMMHIYFKNLGITQYERAENYGIMDVIGSIIKWSLECYAQY